MVQRRRIPEDFSVSDRIIELARQNKWPDPHKEIEAFRDYHLARGTTMADWEAAFRTWLRNATQWRKPPDSPPTPRQRIQPQEIRDPRVRELWTDLINKVSK